jgi:GTP-binding protein
VQIKNVKYESSAISVDKCVNTNLPEFAFIGRSNVGKSSLINMLADNARLAMTSSVPGKTILINHFLVDNSWYLVDLPGYGYAKRSKTQQVQLKKMIEGYILKRHNMANLFLLIDGNIPPQKIDLEFIRFLGENSVPFSLVFTKMDKSRKGSFGKNVKIFIDAISQDWEELPPHFTVSSLKNIGKNDILDYIGSILLDVTANK